MHTAAAVESVRFSLPRVSVARNGSLDRRHEIGLAEGFRQKVDDAQMGILDGKVAIVTGAGKGIGRAESLALAKEGAAVALVDRNKEDAVSVAGEIKALAGRAFPIDCDVSQRDQVDRAVAAAVDAFGPIDILVNNAQAIPLP